MIAHPMLAALEQLIPLLPGFVYLLDKQGHYRSCNPLQAVFFGLATHDAILGQTNQTLPFFEKQTTLRVQWDRIHHQILHTGKPALFKTSVLEVTTPDSFTEYTIIPVFDQKRQVVGLMGLSFDNIDRTLLAQEQSRHVQTEIAFKNITTNLPGHVYWKDREGHYLGCNLLQARDLNFQRIEEMIGKTDYDLSPKEKADAIRAIDEQIMGEAKSIEIEEVVVKEGKNVTVLSQKSPLYDKDNQIVGVLGISFDISERKAMEEALHQSKREAEKANHAKAEFLRNMEHQLRTPFSGIYSLVELLAESETNPERKEMLTLTCQSAKEFLDLLNNIIDFSRNQLDSSVLLSKKFDLKETLHKAITMEKAAAALKKLSLNYHYSDIPTVFIGDPHRLQRLVLNLVSNAIKFTHQGHIDVEVNCVKQVDEHHLILQLIVSDTGIGIPDEQQQLIYEQFYRLHPANQNTYKGAGLGLYVVKKIINELDGEIEVKSSLNQGTTFVCTLPFKRPLVDELLNEEDY
ncbi:PAS domain-containing sensor histidine kinase [Legionella fairfieldensis]|uniref:PAS domain-containing sensor histidine kinase n=1 Tax=Legionella fairfieldensis TaxID=45064 RepID=UPI0010418A20|nr:ATP-binding protein [Legionella fairfieldensis]